MWVLVTRECRYPWKKVNIGIWSVVNFVKFCVHSVKFYPPCWILAIAQFCSNPQIIIKSRVWEERLGIVEGSCILIGGSFLHKALSPVIGCWVCGHSCSDPNSSSGRLKYVLRTSPTVGLLWAQTLWKAPWFLPVPHPQSPNIRFSVLSM